MKFSKTLMLTAAAVTMISAGAIAAEGSKNTDGTHNANNTQTDTNMGADANAGLSNDAAADINANASTEAEMSDTSNDIDTTADTNVTASNATSASSMDIETIQSVQAGLKNEGHKVSIDGKWGPRTAAALRDFQRDNGLTPTGSLDTKTLAALNVSK